jgi:hypothetical protein
MKKIKLSQLSFDVILSMLVHQAKITRAAAFSCTF